ncbi:MAG: phosphatase PAP2-related protein [Candidatus Peribacteraceae bacterium]|nr:phosphatase PAP2-related protein [Candidatus Peribacteraceae bacterium]
MKDFLNRHKTLWSQSAFRRSVGVGILILTIGIGFISAARDHLTGMAYQLSSSPDLILDNLPVRGMDGFIVWGVPLVIAITVSILLFYPRLIPFTLKAIGALLLVRAFFIILTPFGVRTDQLVISSDGFFQRLAYSSNDFFFSGHVAFPFLLALVFWDILWARILMLMLCTLFAAGVLLAHTHYSIDVFAVPFLIPTIVTICKKYLDDPWRRSLGSAALPSAAIL